MNALHYLIRRIKDDLEEPNLETLIQRTFDTIPADEQADMLRLALHDSARRVLSMDRPFGPDHARATEDTTAGTGKRRGVRRPVKSWGRDGIRDHWRRELREWVVIDGGRKFLGDCTVRDLGYLAQHRYALAKTVQAAGDRYAQLAAELGRAHVATVGELPADRLDRIFGTAA